MSLITAMNRVSSTAAFKQAKWAQQPLHISLGLILTLAAAPVAESASYTYTTDDQTGTEQAGLSNTRYIAEREARQIKLPQFADAQISVNEPSITRVIGLTEAVRRAASLHPQIRHAHAAIAQSQAEIAIAESARYPTLEYGIQPGFGGGYAADGSSAGVRTSLGVNQLLYDFGRTAGRTSAAMATMEKEEHLLADTIDSVAYDAASMYIELAASQAVIQEAEQQLKAQELTGAKIHERVTAGFSDISDLYQADMSLQRARVEILQAQTRFDVAAGRLAQLIGALPEQVATLDETGAVVAALGPLQDNIGDTSAVLAARAEVEAAAARLKQVKAERYPSIGVGINRVDTLGQVDATDSTWVGLSLKGSFSLGGLGKHQVAAAEAQRQAAIESLESQQLIARTALISAKREASGAVIRQESFANIIRFAHASRDIYWKEYTLDKRPLMDVINVEHEIYLAQVERVNAIADEMLAQIKSHVATGTFATLLMQNEASRHE